MIDKNFSAMKISRSMVYVHPKASCKETTMVLGKAVQCNKQLWFATVQHSAFIATRIILMTVTLYIKVKQERCRRALCWMSAICFQSFFRHPYLHLFHYDIFPLLVWEISSRNQIANGFVWLIFHILLHISVNTPVILKHVVRTTTWSLFLLLKKSESHELDAVSIQGRWDRSSMLRLG